MLNWDELTVKELIDCLKERLKEMEFIKTELIDRINKMTDSNITETKQQIDKLFEFALLAQTIWQTVPNFTLTNCETKNATVEIENSQDVPIFRKIITMEELSGETAEKAEAELLETFEPTPLDRKLRGGFLKRSNATVYVPEKIIRTNGWVHGDYILATGQNESDLTFEKIEDSTTADKSNRVEIDYCLISESESGQMIIKQQYSEGVLKPTLLNDSEHEFKIESSNAANFRLQVGDIVTIAFYPNRPNEFRIIWIYTDISEVNVTPVTAPRPSSYYKDQNVEKKLKWNEAEKELLKGKKIVIVGADFRANDFLDLVEEAGIACRVLSGDESDARFEAAVRGKDLIISLSSHSSHRSSELAKAFAKKYDISFRAAPTSVSSVKRAIIHGISAKEIPFHSLF